MPTGYTCNVQSGKVTEFRDFAWECARAFGALVELREDSTAAIPERFEPSTSYHDGALARAKLEREELASLTLDQADLRAASEHNEAVASWSERRVERNAQKLRYLAMIEKAEAWEPPSSEHKGMKDFMVQQLRDSLKFDCADYSGPPEPETGAAWLKRKREKAVRDISYHVEERAKEIERTESRNTWLTLLRESIGEPRK